MGYLVFVPGVGYVKNYRKNHEGEYTYTKNRDEAQIWWTFSGAKRTSHKIFGAHVEEL